MEKQWIELPPTWEDILKMIEPIKERYNKIAIEYIERSAMIDGIITDCIACHFIDQKQKNLKRELTKMLVMQLNFNRKLAVLKKILVAHYHDIYIKYEKYFEEISNLQRARAEFAHSFFDITPEYIRDKNFAKIPFRYMSFSISPLKFIDEKKAKTDKEKYDKHNAFLMGVLYEIQKKERVGKSFSPQRSTLPKQE